MGPSSSSIAIVKRSREKGDNATIAILFVVLWHCWGRRSKFKTDQGWSLISSRSDRDRGPHWIDNKKYNSLARSLIGRYWKLSKQKKGELVWGLKCHRSTLEDILIQSDGKYIYICWLRHSWQSFLDLSILDDGEIKPTPRHKNIQLLHTFSFW